MSISNKTRKTLWAKSGNRCCLCRIELIQDSDSMHDDLIIGEECHIISSKKDGPRGELKCDSDFDHYDNLLLLCANDHKRIDELTDIYTPEKLKQIKNIHETWVKTTLEKDVLAFTNDKYNIKSLSRIKTGKQVVDLINGAHMFQFDHDELHTAEEAELVGGFLGELRDYGDILSDMEFMQVSKLGVEFNEIINEIEHKGFLLFGLRRKLRLRNSKKEDMGLFDTTTLVAIRKDNPSIIGDFLIAKLESTDLNLNI
ncbi:HNH endonuclease [Tenacibaculum amylolyticum]|uniref:HNH endonuclease n=1 Tax=Tenacibaculum amylolyticum TaxID=104269 RepID=UPI0038952364